jgi:signal transduction histidine kinase
METIVTEQPTPPKNLTPEILVPRLGDYLVEKELITTQQLQAALEEQASRRSAGENILLGELLIRMQLIDRSRLDGAVTEQILQLRAALQETNQQLERRVQERTSELQTALDKLSELNQLKSNFIANISHELRTPLTHVKGYVELLLTGAMGDLNEQQMNAMEVVQRSTERLEQQIEDLIRFSLASRGEFTVSLSPINVDRLVDGVVSRLVSKAVDKSISLDKDCAAELPKVRGDQEKLAWALMQLIDNAIKFTPAGGQVVLSMRHQGGFLEVAVTDTGIGIPPERMDEIFEPFHQLDGSATRRYGGTGLGLALVKQILAAHGSMIHVQSEVGKGTCFRFVLAIVDP